MMPGDGARAWRGQSYNHKSNSGGYVLNTPKQVHVNMNEIICFKKLQLFRYWVCLLLYSVFTIAEHRKAFLCITREYSTVWSIYLLWHVTNCGTNAIFWHVFLHGLHHRFLKSVWCISKRSKLSQETKFSNLAVHCHVCMHGKAALTLCNRVEDSRKKLLSKTNMATHLRHVKNAVKKCLVLFLN